MLLIAIPLLFFLGEKIYILLFGFVFGVYILGKVWDWVWWYGGMAVWMVGVLYYGWKSSFSFLLGYVDAG